MIKTNDSFQITLMQKYVVILSSIVTKSLFCHLFLDETLTLSFIIYSFLWSRCVKLYLKTNNKPKLI